MTFSMPAAEESHAHPGGWASIPEFARHWGLGESTVRHWVRDGKIPAVYIHGVIRIPRETLDPRNWKEGHFID